MGIIFTSIESPIILIPLSIYNLINLNIWYLYLYVTDQNFRIISGFLYDYYFNYVSLFKSIQLYERMKERGILEKEYEFRMGHGCGNLRIPIMGVYLDKKQILHISFCSCCNFLGINDLNKD